MSGVSDNPCGLPPESCSEIPRGARCLKDTPPAVDDDEALAWRDLWVLGAHHWGFALYLAVACVVGYVAGAGEWAARKP